MLKIYEESYFQDKRIKALFITKYENAKRKYNKEKKAKYENYLKKLGKIAYDELYLNCNAIKTAPKKLRLNSKKTTSTVVVAKNHFILNIPKTLHKKYFSMKHKAEINEYKTISLKYLNQKATFHIYDNTFYYYIETYLELPNYSKNKKYWFKKQFEWFIFKLLREGKLVNRSYTKKILSNIDKNTLKYEKIRKYKGYKLYFNKGYFSFLNCNDTKQKAKWLLGKSRLKFNKTEIPFLHNFRIKVNGKLRILTKDINDYLVNMEFSSFEELFYRFLDIGLEVNGIDIRNITSLELVSFEVARELIEFNKTEHRNIPILELGKDNKRDLGFVGFENYYEYIDYSKTDIYGNKIPEYEIQYFNRKEKRIPEIIREVGYLIGFNSRFSIKK